MMIGGSSFREILLNALFEGMLAGGAEERRAAADDLLMDEPFGTQRANDHKIWWNVGDAACRSATLEIEGC